MEKEIAVIIPCYNERYTIKKVIEKIRHHLSEAKVFVYDNFSPDDTIIKAKGADKIVHIEKRGKGNILKQAFEDIKADYYVIVDGDDTYDISSLKPCLKDIIANNIEFANFKRVSTHFQSFEFGRFYINAFFNKVFNRFYPSQCSDVLSGYKIISNNFKNSLKLQSEGYETDIEMFAQAVTEKFKIKEYICRYFPRHKDSKSKFRLVQDYFKLFRYLISTMF